MKYILFFLLLFFSITLQAQIEKVIVETYYISDINDSTDTTGGKLEAGSTTYRIYIDLKPGSKLKKIYGDANHALKISSTKKFFNNAADGQSFAKDFSKNRLGENTVALDTWLTLGQTTRIAAKTYFGILKAEDTDGSFIGGINNDGGSADVSGGLLVNTDPAAGIPLTNADGLDTMVTLPSSWADYGIKNILSGVDSTIFGSAKVGSQFVSNYAGLQNSGTMGVIPDTNQVLVAQLTTKGEISFELNIEVEEIDGISTKIVKYVANDDTLLPGEKLNRYLKYPFVQICGCPDPNYLEYKADRDCDKQDSCKILIVFGCMDPLACNYDANANFPVQSLCCYPGYCNDRDISIVCPTLSIDEPNAASGFYLYPNPAQDHLAIQILSPGNKETNYTIYDSFGKVVSEKNMGTVSNNTIQQLDISNLASGLYLFRLSISGTSATKLFIKN